MRMICTEAHDGDIGRVHHFDESLNEKPKSTYDSKGESSEALPSIDYRLELIKNQDEKYEWVE